MLIYLLQFAVHFEKEISINFRSGREIPDSCDVQLV